MAGEQRQLRVNVKLGRNGNARLALNHAAHPHKWIAMRQHLLDNIAPTRIRNVQHIEILTNKAQVK